MNPHVYTSLPDLSDGACLDPRVDPDVFHPEGLGARQQARYAKSVCAKCPVATRDRCLSDTLAYEDRVGTRHGVYGGYTADERAALSRGVA